MGAIRLAISVCIWVTPACKVRAEKLDMPPHALMDTATHVIVGNVVQIYERKETDRDWTTTLYLTEIVQKRSKKVKGIHGPCEKRRGELQINRTRPSASLRLIK